MREEWAGGGQGSKFSSHYSFQTDIFLQISWDRDACLGSQHPGSKGRGRRQRFKASLVYKANSRPENTVELDPGLKKKNRGGGGNPILLNPELILFQNIKKIKFFNFYLFYVSVGVFCLYVCMYVCAHCPVPKEVRIGCWILWNWSYQWLWAI